MVRLHYIKLVSFNRIFKLQIIQCHGKEKIISPGYIKLISLIIYCITNTVIFVFNIFATEFA